MVGKLSDEAAPLTLDVEPGALAAEIAALADEVGDGGRQTWIADKRDRLFDKYWSLAEVGGGSVSVGLELRLSSLDAPEKHAEIALSAGEALPTCLGFPPAA